MAYLLRYFCKWFGHRWFLWGEFAGSYRYKCFRCNKVWTDWHRRGHRVPKP
jgi:hypothetical protein